MYYIDLGKDRPDKCTDKKVAINTIKLMTSNIYRVGRMKAFLLTLEIITKKYEKVLLYRENSKMPYQVFLKKHFSLRMFLNCFDFIKSKRKCCHPPNNNKQYFLA